MTTTKKPTAKQVFQNIRPLNSKNVIVYFDEAFRVIPRTKFDGYLKQLQHKRGIFVRVPGQGSDIFAIPYRRHPDATTRQMENSLRSAMHYRHLEIVDVSELIPKLASR